MSDVKANYGADFGGPPPPPRPGAGRGSYMQTLYSQNIPMGVRENAAAMSLAMPEALTHAVESKRKSSSSSSPIELLGEDSDDDDDDRISKEENKGSASSIHNDKEKDDVTVVVKGVSGPSCGDNSSKAGAAVQKSGEASSSKGQGDSRTTNTKIRYESKDDDDDIPAEPKSKNIAVKENRNAGACSSNSNMEELERQRIQVKRERPIGKSHLRDYDEYTEEPIEEKPDKPKIYDSDEDARRFSTIPDCRTGLVSSRRAVLPLEAPPKVIRAIISETPAKKGKGSNYK